MSSASKANDLDDYSRMNNSSTNIDEESIYLTSSDEEEHMKNQNAPKYTTDDDGPENISEDDDDDNDDEQGVNEDYDEDNNDSDDADSNASDQHQARINNNKYSVSLNNHHNRRFDNESDRSDDDFGDQYGGGDSTTPSRRPIKVYDEYDPENMDNDFDDDEASPSAKWRQQNKRGSGSGVVTAAKTVRELLTQSKTVAVAAAAATTAAENDRNSLTSIEDVSSSSSSEEDESSHPKTSTLPQPTVLSYAGKKRGPKPGSKRVKKTPAIIDVEADKKEKLTKILNKNTTAASSPKISPGTTARMKGKHLEKENKDDKDVSLMQENIKKAKFDVPLAKINVKQSLQSQFEKKNIALSNNSVISGRIISLGSGFKIPKRPR